MIEMAILTRQPRPVRPECPTRDASWQAAMRDAVRDPAELCRLLELPPEIAEVGTGDHEFSCFAPRGYVARMKVGDPRDPLLRQVLPLPEEGDAVSGFTTDPVDDTAATLRPGLLQKYTGRVLLVTTGTCAVHCRYCFRRHFPYVETPKSSTAWDEPLAAIAADDTIHEVILSGGDPLTLGDDRLAELSARIARIPHVRRLRIHTRLPIVIPERVTDPLIDWLTDSRLTPIVVIHANHAQELTGNAPAAIAALAGAGIPLLNQAVLLRGVNDSLDAQAELCERLVDLRVLPYYLHQLDRVAGAAHFEVPITVGQRIIAGLRERLPGYAVPRYVQEAPHALSKLPLERF
jgi:EF-P beta-lysylation protein EpmB